MELGRVRESQARLLVGISGDLDPARASLLPGWTIGHLLTHVARNADSVVRRLEGAARDEVVDQYPGGSAGREAEIEAGAGRSIDELRRDVRVTNLAVERVVAAMPAEAWARPTRSVGGEIASAEEVLESRIREVEVHHVDLGVGYTPRDWPGWFVERTLAADLPRLAGRTDPAELLAWLTGRGPAPDLDAWR